MRIPLPLIFIIALLVGIAWLAGDSKFGGELRKTGTHGAQGVGSLLDALGQGSQELGDIVSE